MIRWINRRALSLMILANLLAIVSLSEALRTSAYVAGGLAVPRNPFVLSWVDAQESRTVEVPGNLLLEYRMNRNEDALKEVREDIKELRADFSHITQMLIGSLLAVVINLAITIITRQKRQEREKEGGSIR